MDKGLLLQQEREMGEAVEGQMHDLCRGAVSGGCSEKVSDKVTCG